MAKTVTPLPILDDRGSWRASFPDPDNPGALGMFLQKFASQEAAEQFMQTGEIPAGTQVGRPAYVPKTHLVYPEDYKGVTFNGQPLAGRTLCGRQVTDNMEIIGVYGDEGIDLDAVTCNVCRKVYLELQNPTPKASRSRTLTDEEKAERAEARKAEAAEQKARLAARQATIEKMRAAISA